MSQLDDTWMPTEQAAMDALKHLDDDLVPMKMLFPDLQFAREAWDVRFNAVFKTQEHWDLLTAYATGQRWSEMTAEDAAVFDFWLLAWFDYQGWINGAKRPDHIAFEMKEKPKSKRQLKKHKNGDVHPSDSAEALDQLFRNFISSPDSSVSLSERNSWQRKWLHIRAEQANLQSNSDDDGQPDSKTITLTKPDGWTLPPAPKTTLREQQSAQRQLDEEREDARFQINCKYRAWGYDCPEDMIDGEPELAESADMW